MEKHQELITTLNTSELLIRRRLSSEGAAPFLAHWDLSEQDRTKFANAFKAFLHGDESLIPEALRRWPLTSVWNFANALSHDYGEDGHAVYAVLERAFGVSIIRSAPRFALFVGNMGFATRVRDGWWMTI